MLSWPKKVQTGAYFDADYEAIFVFAAKKKNTPCGEWCGEEVSRGWMMPSNPLI